MKPLHRPIALLAIAAAITLAACSKSEPPAQPPAAQPAAAPAPVQIAAPAGSYELDPYHSSLSFAVNHIGLANYVARFTRYQGKLEFDPQNLAGSSVSIGIEPTSIRTDFSGDYKATHPDSPYATFDEALSRDSKFLNADQFPQISFRSTKVEQLAPGQLRVAGDLTFLGKTLPVTLDTTIVGSMAAHPFTQRGAVGFSAVTAIKRSQFGMTSFLEPSMLGDEVRIRFEGEFHQAAPPAPAAETPAPAPPAEPTPAN